MDTATVPKIYYPDEALFVMNWIAEGSDGNLYVVPAEPGGWLRRDGYEGRSDDLKPLTLPKASTVSWFVYGDVGPVTIASK